MKIKTVEINCSGIATSHKHRVFYPDENADDGLGVGYITVKYRRPRMVITYKGRVDEALLINSVYTDGTNSFVAVTEHEIVNVDTDIEKFSLPVELNEIFRGFSERSSRAESIKIYNHFEET